MEIITIRIQIIQIITALIQGDPSNKEITMNKIILITIRDNKNIIKLVINLRTKFRMERTRKTRIKEK